MVIQNTSLDGKITDEENARIAGDNSLQTNLNSETSARQAADTVLTDAIAAEEARAQSAEAGLQGNIDKTRTSYFCIKDLSFKVWQKLLS